MKMLTLFLVSLLSFNSQATNFYSFQVIESITPNTKSVFPIKLNEPGDVAALYFYDSGGAAGNIVSSFIWSKGLLDDANNHISVPYAYHMAYGMNDHGALAGIVSNSEMGHPNYGSINAVIVDFKNEMVLLGELGGLHSQAMDINNLGQVVGFSRLNRNHDSPFHAFLYDPLTGMKDIGKNLVFERTEASKINNLGTVIGHGKNSLAGPRTGFIWQDKNLNGEADSHEFVLLNQLFNELVVPTNLSNKHHYVGTIGSRAGFLWKDVNDNLLIDPNEWSELTHEGLALSPLDINEFSDIVGAYKKAEKSFGFAIVKEKFYDLNSMMPAGSGWHVEYANSINNRGQILARATKDGVAKIILFNPLRLSELKLHPLKAQNGKHEVIRTDHNFTLSPDAFGGTTKGSVIIKAKGAPGFGDANTVDTIRVRVYSDMNKQGLWVELKETEKNTNEFVSPQAIYLNSKEYTSNAMELRVTTGDRVYVEQFPGDKPAWIWTAGGADYSNPKYGKSNTPAILVPQSEGQYLKLFANMPVSFIMPNVDSTVRGLGNYLQDAEYLSAEGIILKLWPTIQLAAQLENVPVSLVAAVLLQNMRSMNYDDLMGDWNVGKSIGISQTPYYIVQKVAKLHGIVGVGIGKGTDLEKDMAIFLLNNPSDSVYIAAAHVRTVFDRAYEHFNTMGNNAGVDLLKKFFNINLITNQGDLSEDEKAVYSSIGMNMDQWQLDGLPEYPYPDLSGPYTRGIFVAAQDIRRNLNSLGVLSSDLLKLPRLYIEEVTYGPLVPECNVEDKEYICFRAGDMIPNFFRYEEVVNGE